MWTSSQKTPCLDRGMKTQTLTCPKCEKDKPDDQFHKAPRNTGRRGRASYCKDCTRDAVRAHHKRTEYRVPKEYAREYRARVRDKAVAALGDQCSVCDFCPEDKRLLDIDHIDGDGVVERVARSSYTILKRIIAGATGYQLLCPTCHREKTLAAGEHMKRVDKA